MHALLGISSLLLVVLAGHLALGVLGRLAGWSQRRDLQLLVLAAPVVALGVGVGALLHFSERVCFLGAPPWDYALGLVVPLGMGLVALGALGLGLIRLALIRRLVARAGATPDRELQALADRLAERLGAPWPRLRLRVADRPLALTLGFRAPTVVLSTWMVEHLDRRELEAVLAHELGHAARRDYPVVWLATVLRDAFGYLPTSRAAYRQLQREKELACDDLAVEATNRPLALAAALAKVWQQALGGAAVGAAPALTGSGEAIECRIERLMAPPTEPAAPACSRAAVLAVGAAASVGLLALEAVNLAILLAPMGCGPAASFGTLP